MEETLVFVDEGLLKELVEHFGDGGENKERGIGNVKKNKSN